MKSTIMGYIRYLLGLYWDNGKEMETTIMGYIRYILGLYWDNGKENGKYYNGIYKVSFGVILG